MYTNRNIDNPTIPVTNPAFANFEPALFIPLTPNIIAKTPLGSVIYQNNADSIDIIPKVKLAIPKADFFDSSRRVVKSPPASPELKVNILTESPC